MVSTRTLKVIRFMPEDVRLLDVQDAQINEVTAASLSAPYGHAWTGWVGGEPIASAGVVEVWRGRAYAWALLSKRAGPFMLPITREIRSRLDELTFARVEMAVDAGFIAGARWARMLGFECETPKPMRGFLPSGRSALLYARVQNGFRSDNDNDGAGYRSAGDRRDL